mmetsp:Transcript_6930/g.16520  ORF Transcript_6930/g.16520 Transcript_6930/m.16520 type:complete len:221 (-) Transcript_6930:1555-2217(-)
MFVLFTTVSIRSLTPIPVALEVEVKRQHASFERTSESMLTRPVPLSVNDLERNVFIRRSRFKPYDAELISIGWLQNELRCLCPIDEIWVKDIKFVPLHRLWRRIIMIVMRLVVLVPVVTGLNAVEVARLSGAVLVLPCVSGRRQIHLVRETELFLQIAKVGLHTLGNRSSVCCSCLVFCLLLGCFFGSCSLPALGRSLGKFILPLFELLELANQHPGMNL